MARLRFENATNVKRDQETPISQIQSIRDYVKEDKVWFSAIC